MPDGSPPPLYKPELLEEKKKLLGERVQKERKAPLAADKNMIKVPLHLKHPPLTQRKPV